MRTRRQQEEIPLFPAGEEKSASRCGQQHFPAMISSPFAGIGAREIKFDDLRTATQFRRHSPVRVNWKLRQIFRYKFIKSFRHPAIAETEKFSCHPATGKFNRRRKLRQKLLSSGSIAG